MVVIAVEGNAVTLTYTDVHLARAKFFIALFNAFPAQWSGLDRKKVAGLGDDEVFYLVTGRYTAEGAERRDAFLAAIGAGLVFLIDWNKARKVLRAFISNGDAIRILDWAARHRFGHRAFLELGGPELVAAAVRHAAPTRIGFGERLEVVLGRDNTVDFSRAYLRLATQAMLQGQSIRLIRDHVEADLVRHLERVDSALLAIVVRQAGLAHDIAAAIALYIGDLQSGQPVDGAALAGRARRIEEKADRILIEARVTMRTQAIFEAPQAAADVPVVYLHGPEPQPISPLDFRHTGTLVESAYRAARSFLDDLRITGPGLYGSP